VCDNKAKVIFNKAVKPVYEKVGKAVLLVLVENKNTD